jgi:hypothetical protein
VKLNTRNPPRFNLGCIFLIALLSVALSLLFYWLEKA